MRIARRDCVRPVIGVMAAVGGYCREETPEKLRSGMNIQTIILTGIPGFLRTEGKITSRIADWKHIPSLVLISESNPLGEFVFAGFLSCLLAVTALAVGAEPVDFQRDVAPILQQRCVSCHNDRDRRGGLSIQSVEKVNQGGDSGQVIESGDAASSYLWELLAPTDGKAKMPKGEKPLAASEIATIRRWIDEGAVWPAGVVLEPPVLWSLQPISRPAVPPSDAETNDFPIRNSIDAFVSRRLRESGLKAAPAADRRTLIRRLYLDVTGLPPTPAAIEDFVSDSSPRAYQRLVDELLSSPHYGERWGRYWLDLARYADSEGYLGGRLATARVGLSRVGHPCDQPRPAVRSVHGRATGGRLA